MAGFVVTACLRPGQRPTGAEKAMICVRLLASLRRHWPQPPILGRGDSALFFVLRIAPLGSGSILLLFISIKPVAPDYDEAAISEPSRRQL